MSEQDLCKKDWNAFVSARGGSFLQSLEWAKFQELCGRKTWAICDNRGNSSPPSGFRASLIKHNLPFGKNYIYVPRGPIFAGDILYLWKDFLDQAVNIGKQQKSTFLRLEPSFLKGQQKNQMSFLGSMGFINIGRALQPAKNLVVDLSLSEQELQTKMHPKTRYNIRIALKRGVIIRRSEAASRDSDKKIFSKLIFSTAKRQGIKGYAQGYYDKLIDYFCTDSGIKHLKQKAFGELYFAEYNNTALAAALVIYFGARAVYIHGGTVLDHRDVMAPYLLHWRILSSAKENGFLLYDLGGIDNIKWQGITRFKKGFGGYEEEYENAFDLPLARFGYVLYQNIRKILRS
ncbi:MAG: hypothetical protein A3A80_02145 [Candidatus Terrybacteria bacterium RIFCSPLOWO2_01_FULL_44_24]|uniref:BioF2-like acetyltransferase domain-containing protein n=1 Tax=Candidatus Terrybacteria bacterium RIFCSPHIGHO2_01_FULL_43_35 TaxID=1802361 RepID=A0A1G2PED4_9BACT|nr:MAG: hypothetical protein A2828_01935 [Candidatus Terrybacteria bacterium RIFCSPHIGHO2_01_FULL_43_35]OHA50881.1 MAG: hypothetical protein A3A80_02145 [Candidatus Terrybacteria bacterium RIFCSPLOWO2_01_FULL_44_24]